MGDNFFGESNLNMTMPKSLFLGIGFIALLMVAGILVLSSISNVPSLNEVETFNYNDGLLIQNGSSGTLSSIPDGGRIQANVTNKTWLNFIGNPSTINISNSPRLVSRNTDYTISFWMNASADNDGQFITRTSAAGAGSNDNIMQILMSTDDFTVRLNGLPGTNCTLANTTTSISNSQWNNLVVTWISPTPTTGNMSLYINGVLAANYTNQLCTGNAFGGSNIIDTNVTDYVWTVGTFPGQPSGASDVLNGSIDSIRFYNASLSPAEILTIYNSDRVKTLSVLGTANDSRQVLYLSLDEGSSTTAYDTSSSRINGTLLGSPIPVWQKDQVSVTLINNTDYTLLGSTFTLINSQYSQTGINITYTLTNTTQAGASIINNVSSGFVNFAVNIPTLFSIIGVVLVISAIALIIGVIYKVMLPNINSAFSKGL